MQNINKLLIYLILLISCTDIKTEKKEEQKSHYEQIIISTITAKLEIAKEQFSCDSINNVALRKIGWDRKNAFQDSMPFVLIGIVPFGFREAVEIALKVNTDGSICQKALHQCWGYNGHEKKLKKRISFITGMGLNEDIYYNGIVESNYQDTMVSNFLNQNFSNFKELKTTSAQGIIEKIDFNDTKKIFYFSDIINDKKIKIFFQRLVEKAGQKHFLERKYQ